MACASDGGVSVGIDASVGGRMSDNATHRMLPLLVMQTCGGETTHEWRTFLQYLRLVYGDTALLNCGPLLTFPSHQSAVVDHTNIVFATDRSDAAIAAIDCEFPGAQHIFCSKHREVCVSN